MRPCLWRQNVVSINLKFLLTSKLERGSRIVAYVKDQRLKIRIVKRNYENTVIQASFICNLWRRIRPNHVYIDIKYKSVNIHLVKEKLELWHRLGDDTMEVFSRVE